jgi:hypothetical protein
MEMRTLEIVTLLSHHQIGVLVVVERTTFEPVNTLIYRTQMRRWRLEMDQ